MPLTPNPYHRHTLKADKVKALGYQLMDQAQYILPLSPVWVEKPCPVTGVGLALLFSLASLLLILDSVAGMLCLGCQILFCNSKATTYLSGCHGY